jgi:HlyD family secretion protein
MHARVRPVAVALLVTLSSCSGSGHTVRGSGTIEMDEVDVASLTGGRVLRIPVNEGDRVRRGDTLVVLDRGEILAELAAQVAQSGRALAQFRDLQQGPRPSEIQAARATLQAATAQAKLAESEATRTEALFSTRVASQSDLDRAESNRDAAIARREEAARRLSLLEAGSRGEQIAAAEKSAEAANAQLAGARSRARELVLTAPISGVVLLKNFLPGELAQPGLPVLTLGNPDSLWMRVYVGAPKIGRVMLGAPVEIVSRGAPGKTFSGRVVSIATHAEFTPRAALTEEEQDNLVFGVKVVVGPTGGVLKAGLPADARIRAHE